VSVPRGVRSDVIGEPEAPESLSSAPATPSGHNEASGAGRRQTNDWQDEVAARLDGYRRRHERLRGKSDSDQNLDFDFGAPEPASSHPHSSQQNFPRPALSSPPLPPDNAGAEEFFAPEPSPESDELDQISGSPRALEDLPQPAESAERPVEIILEAHPSPSEQVSLAGGLESGNAVAPLGQRFLAAILDTVVLCASGGLFALIFWRAGGRLQKTPLDVAVAGFIASFFTFVYFTAFTFFTAATPGLAAMGLEVRALHGSPPSLRDSFWRGVGYLVSLFPLMLGFIWALVDSDGLTWHDRMSETFIASAETTDSQDTAAPPDAL
jgi:uncharacterized RDD family membrane protein YckC